MLAATLSRSFLSVSSVPSAVKSTTGNQGPGGTGPYPIPPRPSQPKAFWDETSQPLPAASITSGLETSRLHTSRAPTTPVINSALPLPIPQPVFKTLKGFQTVAGGKAARPPPPVPPKTSSPLRSRRGLGVVNPPNLRPALRAGSDWTLSRETVPSRLPFAPAPPAACLPAHPLQRRATALRLKPIALPRSPRVAPRAGQPWAATAESRWDSRPPPVPSLGCSPNPLMCVTNTISNLRRSFNPIRPCSGQGCVANGGWLCNFKSATEIKRSVVGGRPTPPRPERR